MTERGTPAEFARWVEPHLLVLTRYAGRHVSPSDRDDVVQEALIRAWQPAVFSMRAGGSSQTHPFLDWLFR